MKSRTTYTIMIVFLLFIQQVISGCSTTVTKNSQKDNLHKIETGLVSQNLYQSKCALCHELPDINEYSSDEWTSIIDNRHNTKAARKFITIEEAEKIKGYLKSM
ncbi:hypothetical protein S225a_24070 [Candidatus Brocadiaceae bacterium S225]|uniref:Cytochrome c domain-containing protein n=1 Tax=Candidatus Scalindua brodae TaxID=237368 RepID=A0A0B0EKD6_9BACT|nr:MAG: hypothetical protein SCABRO_01207 [Candidatus Scalindua brodae]TWU30750.1 hypothetical protein S225a_24070 [Candidatus Brocadiaceae bacterium S225]